MFERAVLVHYTEIGLKGRNRSVFESRLRSNLAFACRELPVGAVEFVSSRYVVPVEAPEEAGAVLRACAAVPGVANAADALVSSREMHDIRKAGRAAMTDAMAARHGSAIGSFAVDARRSNTDHALTGTAMNIEVGADIQAAFGLRVDLGNPDVTVFVEVVQGSAYVYWRRIQGPGGLPVGTSGKVVALMSAGIDSPVAAWRIAKRGSVVVALHFSGTPQTSDESTRDLVDVIAALSPAGGVGRLYSIAFGDLQRRISLEAPPDLRVLLYRRLMIRVAEAIAGVERAGALVTGESLGQVASQTLENIAAIDRAATLPVLRPLIGDDKSEIIAAARRLGTYDISIRAHPDCCTLFMPRTPATHASVAQLDEAEALLDVPEMVAEALATARHRGFPCAAYKAPASSPGRPMAD